jgi:hypothetical protein
MPKRSSTNRTSGVNGIAYKLVQEVIPNELFEEKDVQKNPAAVALGKLGGLKGGPARAAKLSPEKRTEIARKAANSRWRTPSSE